MNSTNAATTFPFRLHSMLKSIEEEAGGTAPISWLPHGRAFIVADQQRFVRDIIPVYFNQTKMRSFTRQLNLWGFKRMTSGPDRDAWYHKNFVRNDVSKLELVKRTAVKSCSKEKRFVDAYNQFLRRPDFYATAEVQDQPSAQASTSATSNTNGKENEPVQSYTEGVREVSTPYGIFAQRVTLDTESEPNPYDFSNPWQGLNIPPNASDFHGLFAPLVQNGNIGSGNVTARKTDQEPFQFSDATFQDLAHSLFPRPIRGSQTHASVHTEESLNQGVQRRHGISCLSACDGLSSHIPEVVANTQSLGINGHPCVERDNRDVSDAEFKEFLSQYFP